MKKKLLIAGITLLMMITMLLYGFYWAFYDIQRLEGQEIIQKASSPNGTYTVIAYLNNGGATTDYAVLCSVKTNDKNNEKNIYWQYRCKDASIVWIDEQTVKINGVKLNVEKDTYDYRHD